MKSSANTLETTAEQIAGLKQARLLLDSARTVGDRYGNSTFKGLFNQDLSGRTAAITARLDSIHAAWAEYARDSYALYKISRRPSERENALACIRYALSIKPNPELEKIIDDLNQ